MNAKTFAYPPYNYHLLGVATELALHQQHYEDLSIHQLVRRTVSAMAVSQAQIFYDDDSRFFGYLSWTFLTEAQHKMMMEGYCGQLIKTDFIHPAGGNHQHCWIVDAIAPFCSSASLFKQLRHKLLPVDRAYRVHFNLETGQYLPRRIW